jgi:hypothetical protein
VTMANIVRISKNESIYIPDRTEKVYEDCN